jgi:hypothetical protein
MNITLIDCVVAPFTDSRRKVASRDLEAPQKLGSRFCNGDIAIGAGIPNSVALYPSPMAMKSLSSSSSSSKSIPIAKNLLKRTTSELQLLEDEAMAECRDYCMYARILNGINHEGRHSEMETVNNIIRTRQLPVLETSCSYQEDYDKYAFLPLQSACRITNEPSYVQEEHGPVTIITEPDDDDESIPEDEGVFVMDL